MVARRQKKQPKEGQTSRPSLDRIDDKTLAQLFADVAEEDRALANEGLEAYARVLASIDIDRS